MKRTKFRPQQAFTLIELLVVITIIAILAALIVPSLQKAQARAMAMNCMAKAKAAATAIRTYASNWEGWTSSIRDFYVKEFGYRLGSENGYFAGDLANQWVGKKPPTASEVYASKVKDFRCPVDSSPTSNPHGIPSSYTVTTLFNGGNIMNLTSEANQTLMIKEKGKRHPSEGEKVDQFYVFADLHATLGYSGPTLPGLKVRAYYSSTLAMLKGQPESKLPASTFESVFSGDLAAGIFWHSFIDGQLSTGNDWNRAYWDGINYANGWTGSWRKDIGGWSSTTQFGRISAFRFDGVMTFPGVGDYRFRMRGSNDWYGYQATMDMGIGSAGDIFDPTSIVFLGTVSTQDNAFGAVVYKITSASMGYPIQLVRQHQDWHGMWEVRWTRMDTSVSPAVQDPGINDAIVTATYLRHIP